MPERLTGYVIHSKSSRESSLQLITLTNELGRVNLYWRHAKSTNGKRGMGKLQFVLTEFDVTRKGDSLFVNSLEKVENGKVELKGKSIICALYVNELIQRLLQFNERNNEIFIAYQNVIRALKQFNLICAENSNQLERILREFEIAFLQQLGFGCDFEFDYLGQQISPEKSYEFEPNIGLMLSDKGRLYGGALLRIATGDWYDSLSELKYINRKIINQLLNNQPLHSTQLFSQLYG